jgi:gliding motility-associated-like protein
MKKTMLQIRVTISFFLLFYLNFYAQNRVPFTVRYDKDLKGEMLLIGNNILNRDNGGGQRPNDPYNTTGNSSSYNSDFTMNYIDVDGDASTFSSSSGDLIIPNPACFKIVYAGLYWGALLQNGSRTNINKVKLKLPTGGYNDIVGQVIYDADPAPIGGNKPYSCYADVTSLLTGLANPQGTYTVANVLSSQGSNGGTGLCAGWSLFIVYEDPTLPSKSITSFDGFSGITSSTGTLDIPVSGFRTIPTGPVRAEFAFSALEGDNKIAGDYLKINGTTISTPQRPAANFFNSSVTDLGGAYTARNPSSINTLGFDAGVLTIPNPACAGKPGGCVINNGDTAATITLGTTQDTYFYYFNAFAVDIIQPDIVLTKVVLDVNGNDASGANVTLGQTLFYEIGYQNVGNDDAINFTIRDILPLNTIFNPADLDLSGSGGATLVSYTAATRTLILSIPNSAVKVNSNLLKIKFKVKVVPNCNDLSDACSNIIKNQAFATYTGFFSGTVITNDPSISSISTCNLASPSPTNFLVDVTGCSFTKSEVLCGSSVVLTASNGYSSYSWSTSPTGIPVIGTTQSITVTNVGTYYVHNTAVAPCLSIDEVVTVRLFGNTVSNPIIPYADKTVTCPNDGKLLPLIFLCGANATRNIQSNVSDGSSIVWEKLNEASCPVVGNVNCANENGSCTWSQVATGPDYIANTSGQFRMVLNYPGGCFSRFYFNVYQNLLNPTASVTDIFCNTPGNITVGGVPPGYEYSLNGGAYQSSNVFSVATQGSYTVSIRQTINATNPCIFTIPNLQVNKKDLAVDITLTQPLCHGSKGSIQVAANFVRPQYFYKLSQGATVVNTVGPIVGDNYAFNNLNAGIYTVEVSTTDGCLFTQNVTLTDPPILSVTAAITLPLTCLDGEITIYPVGGTVVPGIPPYYYYFINSAVDFQVTPIYPVTTAGVYNIEVVDFNNCKASTSVTVDKVLAPTYTVSKTDELCAGTNSGTITLNAIVPNGNALRFSIDNGVTFSNSPVFNGLAPGNYDVVVEYVSSGSVCVTPAQTITINVATPITFGTSVTADYTCTTLGEITITPWPPTGGTAPYSTSIDGVTFTLNKMVYSGLTNGTYNVSVKDANDCTTVSPSIVFVPMSPPIINSITTTALKCPGNIVDVTVNATGGVFTAVEPVLRYQYSNDGITWSAYQVSNVLTNIAPGTYFFRVTDGKNCLDTKTFTITPLPPITVVGQLINNVRCKGNVDGAVRFTVSGLGNNVNYSYTINGVLPAVTGTTPAAGSTTFVVNLPEPAGTYNIVVTDTGTTCTGTATVVVTEPATPLDFTFVATPIKCLGVDGTLIITATGGWGGYSYVLTPPSGVAGASQISNTFANLIVGGSYTITTTDANGCSVSKSFTLTAPVSPTASIDPTSDLCYDGVNAATIIVSATGDIGRTLEYNINGGPFQLSNTFANLTPGSYTITVRDDYGCFVTLSAVTIAPQLLVSTVLTKDLDCSASPDAIITGTITGGTVPYVVTETIGGAGGVLVMTSGTAFTYTTSNPRNYQFQVVDATGCSIVSGISTVNPIENPAITSVTQTQFILCHGESTAAVNVVIDSNFGTAPFVINVLNTTTGTDYGTQTVGLTAGVYTITVTDSKFCFITAPIAITEPDLLAYNTSVNPIQCAGGVSSLGQICVQGLTGGTAPFTYTLTPTGGGTTTLPHADATGADFCFDNLDFGTYELSVEDANGCTVTVILDVASKPNDLVFTNVVGGTCATGWTVEVEVNAIIIGGPYEFGIVTQTTPPYAAVFQLADVGTPRISTFTGLPSGAIITFIVRDQTSGCRYFETITIPTGSTSTLTGVINLVNNVSCTGNADGNVSFTIDNYATTTTSVDYVINNASTNISTGLSGNIPIPVVGTIAPILVNNIGPLPPGTYNIRFTEQGGAVGGCGQTSGNFTITQSAVILSVSATVTKNDNCKNTGQISAVAQGGKPPYQYELVGGSVSIGYSSYSTFPNASSPILLTAGNYTVNVKDVNGCIKATPVVVLPLDPIPAITAVLNNQCTASEGAFSITVDLTTPSIAPYSYSVDGGAFQNQTVPFTISNLASNIPHTVELHDSNGCGNLVSVSILPPLGLSAIFSTPPVCNNSDGIITATATGGSATYTYAIVPNPAPITEAGGVFSNVPPGNYTITVTDVTTTCTKSVPVSILPATGVTFTTSVTDVSCNGGVNGTITVNLGPGVNDNPLYTYQLNGGLPQNSNLFTGLSAGTYSIQVNSGRGCFAIDNNVTIAEPLVALSVSGVATTFACAPDNSVKTATITVTALDGTGPYTYSIDNVTYFTSNTFDVIDTEAIQNITVYAKDANGCFVAGNTIIINPLPKITASSASISAPIDCNGTGTLTVGVSGGSGNFSYQLLPNGVTQPSAVFPVTSSGDYYFQVNDLTTGCTFATAPYTILPFNTINVVATPTASVTCFGDTNGAIEINVTGYPGATYSYDVLDPLGAIVLSGVGNIGVNPQLISGLTGGSYTVRVIETATPFCTFTTNMFTIASPTTALSVSAVKTSDATCSNDKGTITASGAGGWGTFEYELVGSVNVAYSSSGTFDNLPAGTYTVNVKDSKGCVSSSLPVVLDVPVIIAIPPIANPPQLSCNGDTTAVITVGTPTGGQGSNYSYSLVTLSANPPTVSAPQTSNVFSGLGAGTYAVTVTDGWSCTQTSPQIIINEPTIVTAGLTLASRQTCAILPELTLTPGGGTPPYSYSTDGVTYIGSIAGSTNISVPIPLAAAVTYHYFVKDNNGCVSLVSNDITIDPLEILTANLDLTNAEIFCRGDATGVIVATALGGLGNYTYTLLDGTGTAIIPAPAQTPPGNFTGLAAGFYQVHLDSGDCSFTSGTIEIREPLLNLAETHVITNVSCNGNNDGQIVINATGGTGIIKYAITPDLDQFLVDNTFKNLAAGSYQVIVQDENGCYIEIDFVITQPTPISAVTDPASIVQELCFGDMNAAFSIVVTGGTEPYSTSLDNINGVYTTWPVGQSQIAFTGLTGGNHTVYIRDLNGCEFELSVPLNPSVFLDPKFILVYACTSNVAGNTVTVTIDASNIPADVVYSLDNSPTTQVSNVFTNLTPGDHFIMAHHINGCVDATPVFNILQIEPLVVSLSQGSGLNEIVATTTGGSGIYQYALNGESYGTQNKFIYYHTGDYTVVVTDSYGCMATDTKFFEFIDIEIPNVFTPNGSGTNDNWLPLKTDNYPDMILLIYDRYGREISKLSQGESWDGKYDGKELPMGDYWYVLKLRNTKDDREFIGHFTLYR